MSWTNVEKSKTGDVQYDLESYSTDLTTSGAATSTTSDFNIIGYTEGTVSYTVSAFDTSITAKLEGSNDGSNYFDLNSGNSHTSAPTTAEVLSWCIPCKYVRLSITGGAGTNTLTNIFLNATAGGGGVIDASSGSAQAAGSNKEIQFNDGGFFGGASGALYDKTVNTDTGQIQIAAGTQSAPMISFSDGTHPAGNYDVGFYKSAADRIGVACGSGGDGMDIGVDDTSFATGSAGTPSLNFGVSTAGSDSNTGMFQNGEDIIAFAAGGTELINICVSASAQSTFIAGLNVGIAGNVVGLRRLSGVEDCDWEDGNCGNSDFLIFTASEFTNYDLTNNTPESWAVLRVATASRSFTGTPCGVMESAAPLGGCEITAMKLLPKGFRVPDGDISGILYTNTVQFGQAGVTFIVYSVDTSHPETFPAGDPVPLCASTTVTTGLSANGDRTSFTTTASSDTGNGSIVIIVSIILPNGTQFSEANGGLVGIRVPIQRR